MKSKIALAAIGFLWISSMTSVHAAPIYGGTEQTFGSGYTLANEADGVEVNNLGHSGTTSIEKIEDPAGYGQLRLSNSTGMSVGRETTLDFYIYFTTNETYDVSELERIDIYIWDGSGGVNERKEYKSTTSTILIDGVQDKSGDLQITPNQWAHIEIDLNSHVNGFTVSKIGEIDFKTDDQGAALMFNIDDINTRVPEPATMGLLAIGGIAMLLRRRKR